MAMRGVVRDLVGVFRVKGGPGSGHRGHAGRPGSVGGSTPGTGRAATTQYGKYDIYVLDGSKRLPDKVFDANAHIAYSKKTRKVYVSSQASANYPSAHSIMASVMGEDVDNWVRTDFVASLFGNEKFKIYTQYAGTGTGYTHTRDATRADTQAFRNMKPLFSILRRVGFSNIPVEWRTRGGSGRVTLPIEEVKSLGVFILKDGFTTL